MAPASAMMIMIIFCIGDAGIVGRRGVAAERSNGEAEFGAPDQPVDQPPAQQREDEGDVDRRVVEQPGRTSLSCGTRVIAWMGALWSLLMPSGFSTRAMR